MSLNIKFQVPTRLQAGKNVWAQKQKRMNCDSVSEIKRVIQGRKGRSQPKYDDIDYGGIPITTGSKTNREIVK